jgi:hypothetical protein
MHQLQTLLSAAPISTPEHRPSFLQQRRMLDTLHAPERQSVSLVPVAGQEAAKTTSTLSRPRYGRGTSAWPRRRAPYAAPA